MIPLGVLASSHVATASGPLTAEWVGGTVNNTVVSSVYTFTDVSFGDAAAGRTIALGVTVRGDNGAASVTIGGVAATVVNHANSSNIHAHIVYAAVPTGTSGTIVVTLTGAHSHSCAISLWRIDGPVSIADHQTSVGYGKNLSVTITGAEGGVIIAAHAPRQADMPDPTWTNATIRSALVASYQKHSGADSTTVGSTTITCASLGQNRALAAAAFQPA